MIHRILYCFCNEENPGVAPPPLSDLPTTRKTTTVVTTILRENRAQNPPTFTTVMYVMQLHPGMSIEEIREGTH